MLFINSLTGSFNIFSVGLHTFSLERYFVAIQGSGYAYINSLLVAGAAIGINLVVCSLAGYALARFRFFGRSFFMYFIWLTYAMPLISAFVGIFLLFKFLNLLNNLFALALVCAAMSTPVNTWMAIGYFNTIPKEIEEAALVDGCNVLQIIFQITLPLSAPVLISMATYTFFMSWNEFIIASILITRKELFTYPLALLYVSTSQIAYGGGIVYSIVAAGSVIGTLPVIVIVLFFRKYLVLGFAGGGYKIV